MTLEVKRMKYMPDAAELITTVRDDSPRCRDDSPLSELLCVSNPMTFKDWLSQDFDSVKDFDKQAIACSLFYICIREE